ncbi:hypothetical protein LZ198_27685 [Myxococcus sp. K15C18031901]|uniref:hypothetical protein n=1 Tax=Myxococcus dinghuensis TaxID=2906761 RepID=UPI0020A7AA4A|nr:hypothetical protein [Myxococcus dinghuensis]MCP3102663.1 hypothetical protein [Myxococcus dinghuensis]
MKSFEQRRDGPGGEHSGQGAQRTGSGASSAPSSHPRVAALQALGERLNQGPRVVAQAKRAASLGSRAPDAPIQRVGGAKFGLRVEDAARDSEGHQHLRQVHAAYKAEIQDLKVAAAGAFAGHEGDRDAQTAYSDALRAAELTPQGLTERLADIEGFAVADDGAISFQGVPVANILEGDAAYSLVAPAANGLANVYKKHTLEGLSDTDYVRVRGSMLRRKAWRGITPPERKALKEGRPLRPLNAGRRTEGRLGYNFDASTGAPEERVRNVEAGRVSDLEWLNRHANTELDAIPDDPRLLSFLQTRKGVGKLLSARSTPGDITSNHGVGFSGYGEVEFDLARVPAANILHHYKDAPFRAAELAALVGQDVVPHDLPWETDRANETVLRNRELVLSEIPHAAVTGLEDTDDRKAYEAQFTQDYLRYYEEAYQDVVGEHTGLIESPPAPGPEDIPFIPDHYSALQARTDGAYLIAEARQRATQLAHTRVEYVEAWRASYANAWKRGWEDAAWELPENAEASSLDVPTPVIPEQTGEGFGDVDGAHDGGAEGYAAGEAAARSGPASSSSESKRQESDEDQSGHGDDEPAPDKRPSNKKKGRDKKSAGKGGKTKAPQKPGKRR